MKLCTCMGNNVYNNVYKFGSLPWRSRSQHDLEAKSCPAHNFVIWGWILKLFHRNDHRMTLQQNRVRPITLLCEVGFYKYFTEMITILRRCVTRNIWVATLKPKSQDDPAAKSYLAHNFGIWSSILKLLHINDHHIEKPCRKQHLGRYLEGQGHSMTLQQKRVWPITLLFEVGFYKYWTEMITILKWFVTTLPILWLCDNYTALY